MTVEARGRVVGQPGWRPRVRAEPGDVVEHRIALFNAGPDQLRDVRVKSELSGSLKLVFGSERLKDLGVEVANAHPLPKGLTGAGVRLAPFSPRGAREIFFRTRIARGADGRLTNRVTVKTNEGRDVAVVPIRVSPRGA